MTSAGGWRGLGSSMSAMVFIAASFPSAWGMLVYSDDTSIDARRQSFGSVIPSMRFMNSVVSLMKEGSSLIEG